ncbi:flagellar L-ring protein precursor [Buchnera aphidicola (Cinara tujafilina)]|uniref:Flagellar L-ring protein n=1 Tax=Buchnera aphidicola (Cinara tujafilina) TaxID=261317 RepID=F7WZE4_9GAMM|nr:flagellar basal body L-ring protein FlgH [Buchnera aphidicola]AEH39806.1 flagellar L-ring protein precursor [Buchnera aphidicola (Cinara tujafilina)]
MKLFQFNYKKIFIYFILIFCIICFITYYKKTKTKITFIRTIYNKPGILKKKLREYPSWFSESKKYKIGDLITITLKENIQASNSSLNHYNQEKENNTGIISLLKNSIDALLPFQKKNTDFQKTNISDSQSFINKDSAFAKNVITGTITGIIQRILPNGYLEILGKKSIMINSSIEDIYCSGIINPENIDKNNLISSTHIANCKIHYKYHHPNIYKIKNLKF